MARKSGDKVKLSARDIQKAEEQAHVEAIRGIAVQFGRALGLTIMAAQLPAGDSNEDFLLASTDDAWSTLADKVIALAKES